MWQNGTAVDLNTIVSNGSDWALEEADSINANGDIVGAGVRLSTGKRECLLSLGAPDTPVPEPIWRITDRSGQKRLDLGQGWSSSQKSTTKEEPMGKLRGAAVLLIVSCLLTLSTAAATLTVTSTADSGAGSQVERSAVLHRAI